MLFILFNVYVAGKCFFMAYSAAVFPLGPCAVVQAISSAACLQNKSCCLSLLSVSDYFKESVCVLSLSAYNSYSRVVQTSFPCCDFYPEHCLSCALLAKILCHSKEVQVVGEGRRKADI